MKCFSGQSHTHLHWLKQMDKRQLSHDILNMIERLRIMHDLAKDQNFSVISQEEIKADLEETLTKIKKDLLDLIQ